MKEVANNLGKRILFATILLTYTFKHSVFAASWEQSRIREKDLRALIELQKFVNTDFFGNVPLPPKSTVWSNAVDPCGADVSWAGVSCEIDPSNITAYYVARLDISGVPHSEPPNPRLHPPLPPALAMLSNLTKLDLSFSNLESLPMWLTNLTNLQELSVENNNLTSLPPVLSQLINLRVLMISHNKLGSGSELSPPLATLANLSSLESFYARNNSLRGRFPYAISGWRNLIRLDISWNSFNGSIPNWLGNLKNLESLDISHNSFSGPLPFFLYGILEKYTDHNHFCSGRIGVGCTGRQAMITMIGFGLVAFFIASLTLLAWFITIRRQARLRLRAIEALSALQGNGEEDLKEEIPHFEESGAVVPVFLNGTLLGVAEVVEDPEAHPQRCSSP